MTHSTTFRNWKPEKVLRAVIPLAFWLGVWQLAAFLVDLRTDGHGAVLLPYPMLVAQRLLTLAGQSAFWQAAAVTLGRIFGGFALGVAVGAAVAAATSALRAADWVLTPAVKVIRAVPVASFIVLVLLWALLRPGARHCVRPDGAAGAVGQREPGVAQTDPLLLEAARAYRFGRGKTFRLVYLPSVLPYFASGCATGLGLAWKAGVAAEVLCQPRLAIGTQLYRARITLETPDLFAWTAVVIVLSFLLEYVLGFLFRRLGGG